MKRIGCLAWFAIVGIVILALVGIALFLGGAGNRGRETTFAGDRVGVVSVKGFIADATDTVAALRSFARDDDVRAVVIEVVSPGGVVAPSQEIHDAVKALAEEKPVVAAFGALAASGGYYLAAPATRIVANPGTVTGSIGVILQFQDYQLLLDKVGLRSTALKSGPYKDAGSPFRALTGEEKKILQGMVDDIFDQFVEAVAEGRGLTREEVLALADGRIYSGRQAQKLGLVDDLGGFWKAVEIAAELGGIEGEPRIDRWKKPRKGLLPLLVGDDAEEAAQNLIAPLGAAPIRFVLPAW